MKTNFASLLLIISFLSFPLHIFSQKKYEKKIGIGFKNRYEYIFENEYAQQPTNTIGIFFQYQRNYINTILIGLTHSQRHFYFYTLDRRRRPPVAVWENQLKEKIVSIEILERFHFQQEEMSIYVEVGGIVKLPYFETGGNQIKSPMTFSRQICE